jgi:hypothetical protein
MFGACFQGYIVNRYGSINVLGSGFKYIHCDLVNPLGYLMTTLIVGSKLVFTISLHMNVGSFIWVLNFGVTFRNRFERKDWGFVLGIKVTIDIK